MTVLISFNTHFQQDSIHSFVRIPHHYPLSPAPAPQSLNRCPHQRSTPFPRSLHCSTLFPHSRRRSTPFPCSLRRSTPLPHSLRRSTPSPLRLSSLPCLS